MRKKGKAVEPSPLLRGREAQAALGEGAGSGSGPGRARVAKASAPPQPEFTPVPRKYRHDGWTAGGLGRGGRQKAFIEALADTDCVRPSAAFLVYT